MEMFNCFAEFEQQNLVLQDQTTIPAGSLFAHRVHLFLDFSRGDGITMEEEQLFKERKLGASAILGARVASRYFLGQPVAVIDPYIYPCKRKGEKFFLPEVLSKMGKLLTSCKQPLHVSILTSFIACQHKQCKCQRTNTSLYCCNWMNSSCSQSLCLRKLSTLLGSQPV